MMNPYAILIAALVVMAAVGAAGWKGYGLGQDNIRAEWQAATIKAKEESDAERQRLQDAARKQAGNLAQTLTKEKRLTSDLNSALQAHIRAAKPIPAGCPAPAMDDGLFDLWQRSNAGPEGVTGRGLHDPGGKPAAFEKP